MIKERRYYFRKSVDSESVLCYNKARVKRQIMFPLPFIFIRPWRSWISQQIPILKAGGSNPSGRATRLNLDAIRVPGSAFYFVSSLAFIVEYLFCQRYPSRGDEIDVPPDSFQYSCWFPGFLGQVFQNRPTVDVQPQKEQKQQKTAFLLLLRKAVFSFFRHRQRNDFRLSVRAVLEFDRGRRRWGLTGSRDGRND